MKTITIEGHLRTENGKKAARQLRSQEMVPGVIYGGSAEINFYAPAKAFKTLVYTPDFQIAEVTVDGKSYRTILKDLQFDKVSDALAHVDLLELVDDKKVIATIPLKFTGTAKGVRDGGKLILIRHSIAPGTGDPLNFDINDCKTQRNLSIEGIEQAKKIKQRIEVSTLIYNAEMKFEPLIGKIYHLYQKQNHYVF